MRPGQFRSEGSIAGAAGLKNGKMLFMGALHAVG